MPGVQRLLINSIADALVERALAGAAASAVVLSDGRVRRPGGPRLIEETTGRSIKQRVRTARHYSTVEIRAGNQLLTTEVT